MRITLNLLMLLFVGISSLHAQYGTEIEIDFTEIDSLQYSEFRKNYSSQVIIDSTKKTNSFTLVVNNEIESFNSHNDDDRYYYQGFITPLNSYAINHCSKFVCSNFLLNKESGERKFLFSPYDNECDIPVLSKDQNSLLVFATDVFDTGSFISIYKKNETSGEFNFESFESWTTNRWGIFEAIWISDTSIALMTYDEYGGVTGNELLNVKYFKGELR